MQDDVRFLWEIAKISIPALIIIWLIFSPDKAERIASWLARIVIWSSESIKSYAIRTDIQSRINMRVEKIAKEAPGLFGHPLKIEWISSDEEHGEIKDGEVIVRLRKKLRNDRNLVVALQHYIRIGLLPGARQYLDPPVSQSVDLVMMHRILGSDEQTSTAQFFFQEIFGPLTEEDKDVKELSQKLWHISRQGTLTRVVLREFRLLPRKLLERLPDDRIRSETREFVEMIADIEMARKGFIGQLDYLGRAIRSSIQLVAKRETLALYGLRAHKRRLVELVRGGAETIYIIATEKANADLALHVAYWGQSQGHVQILRTHRFQIPSRGGRPIARVVIVCQSSSSIIDAALTPEETVQMALIKQIPELASGSVEVVEIARSPGVQTKVLVDTVEESLDPVAVCNGPDRMHMKALRQELGESIWFVRWSDQYQEMLPQVLGVKSNELTAIHVDSSSKKATIVVESAKVAGRAIGKDALNVRLATQLTGYELEIVTRDEVHARQYDIPIEDKLAEVRRILNQEIPEIGDGTITIVDIVRNPGVQTHIAVRSRKLGDRVLGPCIGYASGTLNRICKRLGERVFFVRWAEDRTEYLINALGIPKEALIGVEFDETEDVATVTVADSETAAMVVGSRGENVRLATELTDLDYVEIRTRAVEM